LGVFRRDKSPATNTPQRGIRASNPVANTLPANSVFLKPVPNAAPSAPYNAPRALTAAAAQLKIGDKSEAEQFKNRRAAASSAWQSEAWEYYDAIGEIKYAFNLVASVVSRIRLYPAVVSNPAESPSPIRNVEAFDQRIVAAAERALARLDSAYGGQAGLLKDAALNLQVTGECYLSQIPQRPSDGTPESWDIRSVDEITVDSRANVVISPRRELKTAGGGTQKGVYVLPKGAFIGRIWKAHPRFSEEADSSMRGILDLCAELLLLNRTFRATARSRLNAGALYLPDGLSVAANPDPDFPYTDADGIYDSPTPEELEDEFEDQLMDAMTTPIKDEDSASAVVPLIIRGPAELGDKIKQFKFERSFDPALAQRADRVLERILQGLDVPKDIVTGLANVKYSNALQIDEALYKAHIEPLMLLIADALLTVVYLRPYLLANGFTEPEVERIVVWYDPSQVATRNDRAADADSGFEKMAVSFETWRRAHGFSEAEAPSPTEVALRLLVEKGMITPELTEAMLGVVAPDVMEKIRASAQAAQPTPAVPGLDQMLQGGPPPEGGEAPPGLAEPGVTEESAPVPPTEEVAPPQPIAPSDATPPGLAEPTQ